MRNAMNRWAVALAVLMRQSAMSAGLPTSSLTEGDFLRSDSCSSLEGPHCRLLDGKPVPSYIGELQFSHDARALALSNVMKALASSSQLAGQIKNAASAGGVQV